MSNVEDSLNEVFSGVIPKKQTTNVMKTNNKMYP